MHDYPIEVALLAGTRLTSDSLVESTGQPDSEALIEYAGRLCWASEAKTGTTPDRIQKWMDVGHMSMIEHSSLTFFIRASRVFTHELVRHRIASFSMRSQRFVKENEPQFIVPPERDLFAGPPQSVYYACMEQCWLAYERLLFYGIKPEIARYLLPGACETQIVVTMNFRELRHFIALRTHPRALPEMQCVAGKIREICKQVAPQVFGDL
ncbi:hypothetical protein LCGC14_1387500 [marine sediment metagenome]|uniref:Thymidylate synthase (FAD) n=1 Tax=marine sediment metagenome TaxID=412755 RepID=A0A0F9K0Y3_9ZZZZ